MSDKIYVQIDGLKREANADELAQIAKDAAEELELSQQAKAKAEARTNALAKLAALGLTEEEIAAL